MFRCLLFFSLSLLIGAEPMPRGFRLSAPEKVEANRLVRVTASGDMAGGALVWDVSPEDPADVQELPGGAMVFAAPPGIYRIKARLIKMKDGATTADCARCTVEVMAPKGTAPPPAKPEPTPRAPKADPAAATAKLRVGSSGCTATVIYPRRPDGRWDVLTASHCTGEKGTRGTITLKDGRLVMLTVAVRNRTPDLTWFTTDSRTYDDLPYAVLAKEAPAVGTAIWHNGYGVDKPGNREEGTVTGGVNTQGMLTMRLSVSSGDSGGGIFRVDNGELVSSVCCTSSMARPGTMHGGACTVAWTLRPSATVEDYPEGEMPMSFPPSRSTTSYHLRPGPRLYGRFPPTPRPPVRPWRPWRPLIVLPRHFRGIAEICNDVGRATRGAAAALASPVYW